MNIPSSKTNPQMPRFHQFDCVVLKRDLEGTVLRKGDVGAIMDVYRAKDGNYYDVDFTEKRELENVPECALKLDFRLNQKKGKTLYAPDVSQPPPMAKDKSGKFG